MQVLGYSVKEAGQQLGGMSRASIYRAIARGDLKSVRIGGRTVITADSVRALFERSLCEAA